jgi:iron(III) transport system ATP-binding protein
LFKVASDVNPKTEALLKTEGLCRRYGQTAAVDHVSFEVRKGEFFSLLGPSGCGKSTTLRLVAGLEEPDGGEIWLNGEMMFCAENHVFVPAEKRNIGLVFQSYAVWPHMTVQENISYPLEIRRCSKGERRKRTLDVLELVGLGGLEKRYPSQLSGGQQQRLALARSLVYEPSLLLLDEPLSNVDAKLREQLRIELRKLQQTVGVTILYVTHDQTEALSLSHRIAIMNGGRIEQIGTPEEIYKNPVSFFVQEFVGRLITFKGKVVDQNGGKFVELGDRELIRAEGDMIAKPAEYVRVAVRPEDIQLYTNEREAQFDFITGTVADVSYVGSHYECAVVAAGEEFVLEVPATHRLKKGESIRLRLKGLKTWAV